MLLQFIGALKIWQQQLRGFVFVCHRNFSERFKTEKVLRYHTASFFGFIPSLCDVFDRLSPPKQLLIIKKEKLKELSS